MSTRPAASSSTLRPPVLTLSPHPKPGISLEEWEAKTTLSETQLKSVNAIKAASEKAPLPLKFLPDDDDDSASSSHSGPSTPVVTGGSSKAGLKDKLLQGHGSASSSRPSTPALSGRVGHPGSHALHPKVPVQTPQQFYDWFALIDRSVAHNQEAHYRAHVATVSRYLDVCDLLLQRIQEVEDATDEMLENWRTVEEGGKSLKDACERLLEERDNLLDIVEDVGGHLEYFQELEHATRMLNHPGESLIFQPDFLYMVERVDICISFLKNHRHYREAEVYLLRFQQCMTRTMTLIKMNFVGSLRALSSEIYKRINDNEVSSTGQMHLLYTRFSSVATRIAPLIGELERRAQTYPDELSALLAECRSAYFSTRRTLLIPRITEEIKGLDPSRSELVELTRSGCSYLKQLCTDEFNLYRQFFSTAEDQLYQYLENLCDLLYDDLRPRILHEPRLTVLCEVCTVLQALMVLDASSLSETSELSSDEDEDGDDDDAVSESMPTRRQTSNRSTSDRHEARTSVGRRLHISHLLKMVLQDAQTRLFFKAQSVIQSEIRHFVPKPEDLAYPDILVAARKPLTGNEIREKESYSQIFRGPSLDKQDTWYPTLRKTVWVLSQLHDFVKPAIFEDIAQEALSFCRLSVLAASDLIKTRASSTSALDASLFATRHFLILKEMFNNLEADIRQQKEDESATSDVFGHSGPGFLSAKSPVEFGVVTDTLSTMINKTTSLLPESLFASLGVTRGVETDMRGVKVDIDFGLRKACEDVITSCAVPVCAPIEDWIVRVKATPGAGPPTAAKGTAQFERAPGLDSTTSAAPSATLLAEWDTISVRFIESINRDLRANVGRVRLYLEDERTVRILLGHVQEKILDTYGEFLAISGTSAGAGAGPAAGSSSSTGNEGLSRSRVGEMLEEICSE